MTVLVTGGAGYIGSHMAHALLDRGERVVVVDDLSTGLASLIPPRAVFVQGDVGDRALTERLLKDHAVDAVIHFAGSIVVPESVSQPLRYYRNNTSAARSLIEASVDCGVGHFIFSSTAAVYGTLDGRPATEEMPTAPDSPYGRSKLMVEWMLQDASAAHPQMQHMALRYFNVAGADPGGRTGQSGVNATHLIKRAVQVVLGKHTQLDIFGTDYETPDGTGVRDYIHVTDLAHAHLLALDALRGGARSRIYNCGYGRGSSVKEIVRAVEAVIGEPLPVRDGPRRPGDPAVIVADPSRIKAELGWQPQHDDLAGIIASALAWERRLHNGWAERAPDPQRAT